MQEYLPSEVVIFSAKKEHENEFDFSLPEYLPGIARIIKTKAMLENCVVGIESNHACLELKIKFDILYLSDFRGKIKKASFYENVTVPFKESFAYEDEYYCVPSVYVSHVTSKTSGLRSLHTRCVLNANLLCFGNVKAQLYSAESQEKVFQHKKNLFYCEKTNIPEHSLSLQQELTLSSDSPAIGEIIYTDAKCTEISCVCKDGKLDFEGEMLLYMLYEAAQEDGSSDELPKYTTQNFKVKLDGFINSEKINENQKAFVYIDVNSVDAVTSFDGYGESKVVSFNVDYTLLGTIYEEKQAEVVKDAFSTQFETTAENTNLHYDSVNSFISQDISTSEKLRCDTKGIVDISDTFATIQSVSYENSEGKIFAHLKCMLEIFAVNESSELVCIDVPTTIHIPISEVSPEQTHLYPDIFINIKECPAKIQQGEIICEFKLGINGAVSEKKEEIVISALNENNSKPLCKKKGKIIVCYPQKDTSLWSVAKKYCVSPEDIKNCNSLEDCDTVSKHILVIPQ